MAWTDLLFKDKGNEGKTTGKREDVQPSVTPYSTVQQPNLLPGLNFPILVQQPRAAETLQPEPQASSVAGAIDASAQVSDHPVEEPRVDPLTEKLVAELSDRVRKDAGAGYKTFHVMRERMTQAAQGATLPLSVILAAANVKPSELVEEVRTLEMNLNAAVTELESDITATENNETGELQNDVAVLEGDVEQQSAQIAQLTEQLETLRRQQREAQQQMAAKNATIRQKRSEANAKRQRLKVARARVAAQLAEEKRTFLNR